VPLHHEVHGPAAGLPVLLIHGFPYDGRMWEQTAKRLAEAGCKVIVPDLRGFGKSPLARTATMREMADDLVAVLDKLGVRQAVVVGFSMGGYVALQLGNLHRERVAGMILADTRAGADLDGAKAGRKELAAKALKDGMQPVILANLPKQLTHATQDADPALVNKVGGWMASQRPAGAAAALLGMMDRPDMRGKLAGWNMPCLAVVGDQDEVIPPDEVMRLAQAFRGSETAVIPGAAHLAPVEQAARFNQECVAWLARTFPLAKLR
jgi:pimeloyl-ACP methyl ester carboxylesterase